MNPEVDQLRAELAAAKMEIAALERQRESDIAWMATARTNLIALTLALESAKEGKEIGQAATDLLERARRVSKWL
jgi:hypothetical protein